MRLHLQAAVSEFDVRADTAVTGMLSGIAGEDLLVGITQHSLGRQGVRTERLRNKPRRDDDAFIKAALPRPAVRDLDGWLAGDTIDIAVEAKCITAASYKFASVPASQECVHARARALHDTIVESLQRDSWDSFNKILLPLRAPVQGARARIVRRVLAIWYPCSSSGAPWSTVPDCSTIDACGNWVPTTVDIFSGSLYARELLAANEATIDIDAPRLELAMRRLRNIFVGARTPSAAGGFDPGVE